MHRSAYRVHPANISSLAQFISMQRARGRCKLLYSSTVSGSKMAGNTVIGSIAVVHVPQAPCQPALRTTLCIHHQDPSLRRCRGPPVQRWPSSCKSSLSLTPAALTAHHRVHVHHHVSCVCDRHELHVCLICRRCCAAGCGKAPVWPYISTVAC